MKMWKKVATLLVAGGLTAGEAVAQVGSYGSPSLLPLPATDPHMTTGVPAYSTGVQRTGATVYYPQPQYQTVARRNGMPTPAGDAPAEPVSPSDTRPTPTPVAGAPVTNYQPGCVNGGYAGSYSGNYAGGCAGRASGDYQTAMTNPWSGDCGASIPSAVERSWFASVGGLVMSRDKAKKFWTTYETNNNPNQLMNTQAASADWAGGAEVTIGKWCECSDFGMEVTYWGVWGMDGDSNYRSEVNLISTPMDVGSVLIGNVPAGNYFDNAREHRINRENDFNNLEITMLRASQNCACNKLDLTWLAGFRYFRFNEKLSFESVQGGHEFGDDGGFDQAGIFIHTENNLFGFQVGTEACWHVTDAFSLKATPKVGIYGNHVENEGELRRGDGLSVFDVHSTRNDFAMIGQIDVAADYQFGCHLHVFGGYRAMAISGLALSDNQIPFYLADTAGFGDIDTSGRMVLHGAFAGLEYRF